MRSPVRLLIVKRATLSSSWPGRLDTISEPALPLTGPTLASHGPPVPTCRALPEKPGGAQPPPAGGTSVTPQIAPAGTLTVAMPGLGSTTATGPPVYGPPWPEHVMLNT